MIAGPTHQMAIAFTTCGARARASSSLRIACSIGASPAPPYSLGPAASRTTAGRRATYQDLMEVPEHLVAEIIDGELVTSPRPASPHALAAMRIGTDLGGAFDRPPGGGVPGGWWLLFEPELHLGEDVIVPD